MADSISPILATPKVDVFDFHGHRIRVLIGEDGEPRWIASDVAKVLGYSSTAAMTRSLDPDEKGVQIVHTPGGPQEMTVTVEGGLGVEAESGETGDHEQRADIRGAGGGPAGRGRCPCGAAGCGAEGAGIRGSGGGDRGGFGIVSSAGVSDHQKYTLDSAFAACLTDRRVYTTLTHTIKKGPRVAATTGSTDPQLGAVNHG